MTTIYSSISIIRIPKGFGRRSHIGKTNDNYFKIHKRSFFFRSSKKLSASILPVFIVIAVAYVSDDINRYNYITYSGNYNDLINEAEKLANDANVRLPGGCGIVKIIKFQNHLGMDYRITVFLSRDGKIIYFKSFHTEYKFTINLLLDGVHYSVILNPSTAFAAGILLFSL